MTLYASQTNINKCHKSLNYWLTNMVINMEVGSDLTKPFICKLQACCQAKTTTRYDDNMQ